MLLQSALLGSAFAAGFVGLAVWSLFIAVRHAGWARRVAIGLMVFILYVVGSGAWACGEQLRRPDDFDMCAPAVSFVVVPLGLVEATVYRLFQGEPVGSS